jgi:RHS repeat-associated protein
MKWNEIRFQYDIYYTGREYDKEIGLYYNRARYYSPKLWRFIARDPIDIADDINLYVYVGNNPVMYVDLMGTEKVLILLAIDKSWEQVSFDENWNIIFKHEYITLMADTLTKDLNKDWAKYDIEFISNFDDFDFHINEKEREDIYLIAHWNEFSIDLNTSSKEWNDKINKKSLKNDTQNNNLSSTDLILLSCNTWNDRLFYDAIWSSIQKHYWFKETLAPDNYIRWNWYIWNDYKIFQTKWEFNTYN